MRFIAKIMLAVVIYLIVRFTILGIATAFKTDENKLAIIVFGGFFFAELLKLIDKHILK